MGRGLSELQRRILVYARDNTGPPRSGLPAGADWFRRLRPEGQEAVGDAILPGRWSERTASDHVSISRALARLERRGLVVRIRGRWKRCTQGIALTPRGREVASGLG